MGKSEARPKGYGGGDVGGSGSPGKIFVGGLPRDTTLATFQKHFGNYGEIVDSVIMKNKQTSQPRGFGFITYSDPAIVDKVMEDTHVINGKQVEIKRTIPKDYMQSNPKDFRTKKIFVGGLPPILTEDDLKDFFEKYGAVVEHQIMRDHQTRRSRGFGFVVFESEEVVDDLLANGNMIDLAGSKLP
ncbi:heterogeneous nuclear ribonucleoprotein 1 isoform X3 [Aegilops tauschii subsp. strangulata]|uniref:heterogeneous nuclear ribonucleoprotein 1 isoform X3 n=1 Tax=Aegilops tauschii subsp. strangulata TaxID=200361 RepID=UPI00098A6B25|nr:heterogeneous nuclear ribonucleoprotein 1 isoform X4 [Aegilops tauschii subsp. strangulata]XP_044439081.1 heterogeneous nuclear ribonucleoprotein 1 isoform X3 [Triticum aestivum]